MRKITLQAWTDFEQTTLLRYRRCDINQELTSQLGACYDNNSLLRLTKDFVGTFFFSFGVFTLRSNIIITREKLLDVLTVTI